MQSAAPQKTAQATTFAEPNVATSPFTLAARLDRVERKLDAVTDEVTLANAGLNEVLAILRGVAK